MIRPLAVALGLAAATALPAAAQQGGVEVGVLDCVIEGGVGLLLGSSKEVNCTFRPARDTFESETYVGVVNKFGLDVGVTGRTMMQWLVLAPTDNLYAPGALEGNYVGASAGASAVVGAGANLLVGGSGNTFTLQPLSVEAQTGVNVAVGVSEFRLRAAD